VSNTELLTILCSVGGSLLAVWGSYKFFQGRTEEWRASVQERFVKAEKANEILRRRSHRHGTFILTHELELEYVMRKLNIPRGRRSSEESFQEDREDSE